MKDGHGAILPDLSDVITMNYEKEIEGLKKDSSDFRTLFVRVTETIKTLEARVNHLEDKQEAFEKITSAKMEKATGHRWF